MKFKWFRSRKKKDTFESVLQQQILYHQAASFLTKAASLQKLGRNDEASKIVANAEKLIRQYASNDKGDQMTLAWFYLEVDAPDKAEEVINGIFSSQIFQLDRHESIVLRGALQKIQREKPHYQRTEESPKGFSQVYCCQNCGRIHRYVSMPCPYCDWSPDSIDEMARSIILSNSHFKIPSLLLLSREMAKNRTAADVVPNLMNDGKKYIRNTKQRETVEQIFTLLKQNEDKNRRDMNVVHECPCCGEWVLASLAEECNSCGEILEWSDFVRTLACIDNLLWLFEQRIELLPSEDFSEFVCLLVVMADNMLRKQETPTDQQRKYALELLSQMAAISDLNKGAIIKTGDPQKLEIYLIKDNMREDSETFGRFMYLELQAFIDKMIKGIQI